MAAVRAERLSRGQILRITLDSPPANIVDDQTIDALFDAIDGADDDAPLKLILFASSGRDFSTGSLPLSPRASARLRALLVRLLDCGVPTAAAIRGACKGAAFDLAAFCNFIFVGGRVALGTADPLAQPLPTPASFILPLKLGQQRALDVLLLGQSLDAAEAYRRGLVTALTTAADDLPALVTNWVSTHILPKSAPSLRLANRAARLSFAARLRPELAALDRLTRRDPPAQKDLARRPPRAVAASAPRGDLQAS